MTSALIAPGADFSGSLYGTIPLDPLHTFLGETEGLTFCLDPDQIPGVASGAPIARFNDTRGRPVRASGDPSAPSTQPILFQDTNGLKTFQTGPIAECSLTHQDRCITPAGTIFIYAQPLPASINGSVFSFLLTAYDGPNRRLSFGVDSATVIAWGDASSSGAARVAWTHGPALAPGVPVVLALQWDTAAGVMAIFCNDGSAPVAQATGQVLTDHSNSRWTFFGAKFASGSWRGGAGLVSGFNRRLSKPEMIAGMDAMRDFYGIAL